MKLQKRTILFVTPEIVPFKATGGLADVAEALPEALIEAGQNAIRVMPKYAGIEDKFDIKKQFSFIVETGKKANVAEVYKFEQNGLITFFIGNHNYFERDNCYGYEDDGERFGFFCKAVVEMLMFLDIKPDIIHLNDWQSAFIGLLLKEEYYELDFYKNIKLVFTIHNLQYQGVFDMHTLDNLNLSAKYFNPEKIEYYGKVCFMKAGIVYSDMVTTVSETYAKEIQTPIYGYGLDGLLRRYSYKISGILNGIYYSKYDPSIDSALYVNFSEDNFRENRKENKRLMQKELGLPEKDVPMFGVVTRFAEQKGIDLIIYAMKAILFEDVQFVILGSGEEEYERKLLSLESKYSDQVKINIQFNQDLARRIYGTCDFFLMPSLFEPCGLSQLYSLRYGSIPIVRETGGLLDTILDYDKDKDKGIGFSFKNFNGEDFLSAIYRCLSTYEDRDEWNKLVERAMKTRFSWSKAAESYIEKYEALLADNSNV
ncbi:MAG: starch synthase [Firmicutes bacterium HGW-Firmicutes-1]|jgi:starch synthase|nr:MAG: starch synthase [Firmicutes bacterium HGW-Firmicutes-1]